MINPIKLPPWYSPLRRAHCTRKSVTADNIDWTVSRRNRAKPPKRRRRSLAIMAVNIELLYNCCLLVLPNVPLSLKSNYSELQLFIDEALNRSDKREVLKEELTDCYYINQDRPFDLPWWQKFFWSLVYAVILLVATGGNIIVIWIVLGKKTNGANVMRHVFREIIASLTEHRISHMQNVKRNFSPTNNVRFLRYRAIHNLIHTIINRH